MAGEIPTCPNCGGNRFIINTHVEMAYYIEPDTDVVQDEVCYETESDPIDVRCRTCYTDFGDGHPLRIELLKMREAYIGDYPWR